jgi:hypothetical protein
MIYKWILLYEWSVGKKLKTQSDEVSFGVCSATFRCYPYSCLTVTMSDKTTSSVGPRSFETISEEETGSPWDKLLGDEKNTVPIIIKTEASSTTSRSGEEVSLHPQAMDLESSKLTRSKSLVNQRRNSSGLLASIPRQLRNSLRGVHSEPSSVKDVPTTRNDSSLNLLLRWVIWVTA